MAKERNNNIRYIVGGIIIILLLVAIFMNFNSSTTTQGSALNRITLTPDNFVYVSSSYLNGGGLGSGDLSFCEKRKQNVACGITADHYTPNMPCPNTDIFDLYIKSLNIDSSYNNQVSCKIFDGSEIVKTKILNADGSVQSYQENYNLGASADTGIGHITLFLDYMYAHSLMTCCMINSTYVATARTSGMNPQTGKQYIVNAGDTYGTISNEVCLPKIDVKPVC